MRNNSGPILDMTPDGDFTPAGAYTANGYRATAGSHRLASGLSFGMILARLAGFGLVVGLGLLIFWLTIFTLPFVFLGGLYGVYRLQIGRFRQGTARGSAWRSPFIVIRR
jgi:hypothetical protein